MPNAALGRAPALVGAPAALQAVEVTLPPALIFPNAKTAGRPACGFAHQSDG